MPEAVVQAVFSGRPRSITDERGTWTSSIFRNRVDGPISVLERGLAGDAVAQPYHGGPGAAICVHLADHYAFWNRQYTMSLSAGAVGENLTLEEITEDRICVGDCVRLGTAVVQVSGPRIPCANLARRIGRSDWVKLTILENRTGFYLRVLSPGVLQAGDAWRLEERLNHDASIPAINRCMYLKFDREFAGRMLEMSGLEGYWKDQARQKMRDQDGHWTTSMKEGGT